MQTQLLTCTDVGASLKHVPPLHLGTPFPQHPPSKQGRPHPRVAAEQGREGRGQPGLGSPCQSSKGTEKPTGLQLPLTCLARPAPLGSPRSAEGEERRHSGLIPASRVHAAGVVCEQAAGFQLLPSRADRQPPPPRQNSLPTAGLSSHGHD